MFSLPSLNGENLNECLGEILVRSVKTQDAVEGFHLLENSHKLCRGFHEAVKAWRTCFISFINLQIFRL